LALSYKIHVDMHVYRHEKNMQKEKTINVRALINAIGSFVPPVSVFFIVFELACFQQFHGLV